MPMHDSYNIDLLMNSCSRGKSSPLINGWGMITYRHNSRLNQN